MMVDNLFLGCYGKIDRGRKSIVRIDSAFSFCRRHPLDKSVVYKLQSIQEVAYGKRKE